MSEETSEEETLQKERQKKERQKEQQKEQLARLAELARLRVGEEDSTDFALIAAWFEKIKKTDTEGITPMTNPREENARLREDRVDDGDVRDALLANAPETQHGFFVVPKVVE